MSLAICALTEPGAALARRLGAELPDAEVWLPERLRSADRAHYSALGTAELLPELFSRVSGLICIMATGIVMRSLAPHLRGKSVDPAVVVVDEAGSFAISLLSGHLGGANDLARRVAELTGGQAVITTATDVHGLLAWDEAARRADLAIEPLKQIQRLNSLLLRGAVIALVDPQERIAPWFATTPGVVLTPSFHAAQALPPEGKVFVTHCLLPEKSDDAPLLLLRPRDLFVGLGCNRGTTAEEIEIAVKRTLENAGLVFSSIAGLATISAKSDEAGLLAFSRANRLPLNIYEAAELNRVTVPSPPSAHALAAVGAGGVCEPAALLAAGGGRLLVSKQKLGNVTVAVAEKA